MGPKPGLDFEPRPLSMAVVILAAGSSTRMGTPKMLLPWGNSSMLGHILARWQAIPVAQVGVVIAQTTAEVCAELDRLEFPHQNRIPNPSPECGMFGSIQCAAAWPGWNSAVRQWAIVLGDQPQLQEVTLRQLVAFANQNPERVCQPKHRSEWRHPVVLPKAVFGRLGSSSARTLREFLAGLERVGLECADPGLDYDIDTPEDYLQALAKEKASCDLPLQ